MKVLKLMGLVAVVGLLGGCVSAGTSARLCADLGVVSKVVGSINQNAGQTIADYTPAKCVNAGVAADAGNLTGSVTAGITNK
jgi:hypothetical protein